MRWGAILLIILAIVSIASAKTFESGYSPARTNYFYISEIEAPEQVDSGQNFEVIIHVKGVGWSGTTVIKPITELTISPSVTNLGISEGDNVFKFNVQSPSISLEESSVTGIYDISFEVCETNQFSESFCDEEQISVYVKEKEDPNNIWLVVLFLVVLAIVGIAIKAKLK